MLIRCFIWSEKRDEKVDTDVPSCGTGFIGLRNGVYDVAERCFPGDEKGFFIVRKSLFHRLEEPFPDGMTGATGRQEGLC